MVLWTIKSTVNLPIPISTLTLVPNKQAVLSIIVLRARTLCDQDSLHAKLVFLMDAFRQNLYNDRQIHRVLNRRPNISRPDNKPDSVAFLSYVGTIFNRISRVLYRHNIKSVDLPPASQR
jgi:hypothetical protein